jgi:hypothetical protein
VGDVGELDALDISAHPSPPLGSQPG